MPSVDERVVQLQFDNKQFESGVKTSLNTLNKFDSQLNGLDFSKMSAGIDSLSQKFSVLGIAGVTAVSRITNALMDFGKKKWNESFGQIVSGGISRAQNIADAKFMLKGLGLEWEKQLSNITLTEKHMTEEEKKLGKVTDSIADDIDYGVKDTAYGLDAAAKAAAQLKASSVEVGDPMRTALRGISGVAAMTNTSYEEISQIFTTVAGQGKLMSMQLMQLSTRGMNAAAILGEQLGKSEAEIRDMTTKGKISFEMFAKAMDDAFGEHAKEANQTFQGASSNLRAAFSRIGADFYSVYMDKMIPVLNGIKSIVDDIRKFTQPMSKTFEDLFGYFTGDLVDRLEKIHEYLTDLRTGGDSTKQWFQVPDGVPLENFKNTLHSISLIIKDISQPIKDAFSSVFPPKTLADASRFSKTISDIFKQIADFTGKLSFYKNVKGIFEGIFSGFKIFGQVIKVVAAGVFDLATYIGLLINPVGSATASFGEWVKELADSGKVAEIATKVIGKIVNALKILINIVVFTTEKIKGFFGFLREHIDFPSFDELKENIGGAIDKFEEFKSKFGEKIAIPGLEFIGTIFKAIGERLSNIGGVWDGIKKFFSWIFDSIKSLGSELWDRIEPIFDQLGSNIGKVIAEWNKKPMFEKMKDSFNAGMLVAAILKFIDLLKGGTSSINIFKRAIQQLTGGITPLERMFPTITSGISGVLGSMKDKARVSAMEGFAKALLELAGALFILSIIPSDKLAEGFVVIMGLMQLLQQILVQINGLNDLSSVAPNISNIFGRVFAGMQSKAATIAAVGATLLAMSVAVAILGGVIALLEKIFKDDPHAAIAAAITVAGMLVLMIESLNRINITGGKRAIAAGFALVEIANALMIVGLTIAMMTAAFKIGGPSALFAVLSVIGILYAVVGALNDISINSGARAMAAGFAIVEICNALFIVGLTISMLTAAFSKGGPAALFAVLSVIGILYAVVAALNGISVKSGATSIAAGFAIIEISTALLMIAGAVKLLSSSINSKEGAAGSLIAFIEIASLFGIIAGVLMAFPVEKAVSAIAAGFAMVEISVALLMVANTIKVLTGAVSQNTESALLAWGGIIIAMMAMVAALNILNPVSAIANAFAMIELAAALAIIAGIVGGLGRMDWDSLIKGLVGLAGVLAIIAVFAGVIAGTGVGIGLLMIAASILAVGAAMLAAGAGIALFGAGLLFIVQAVTLLASAWASSGSMIISGITGTISAIVEMIPTVAAALAHGILVFVEIISSHFPIIVELGVKILDALLEGVLQSAEKIASVTIRLLAYVLSALAENIDSIASSLNTILIALMERIDWTRILTTFTAGLGEMFGTAIGSVVGGALGAIMQGIIDAVAQVDYTSLAKHLNGFIEELTPFIEGSKLIDPACMEGIKNLAEAVIVLTAADFLDGISRFLGLGGTSLKKMGNQLNAFAPALVSFANTTSAINGAKLAEVSVAMEALFKAAGEAPNEGGLISKLTGDNTLDIFVESLPALGKALASFGSWAAITDISSINAIAPVMVTLFKALMEAPNTGGLISKLTGDNDIGQFTETLPAFGKALSGFGAWAAITNADAISSVCPILTSLFTTLSTIPKTGGWIDNIIGGNGIDEFGPSLEKFGIALYKFGYYAEQTNLDAVTDAVTNFKDLVDILNSIETFDESITSGFISAIQVLADDAMKTLCEELSINNSQYDILKAIQILLDDMVTALDASKKSEIQNGLKQVGKNFITGFANGILDNEKIAIDAAEKVATDTVLAMGHAIGDTIFGDDPADEPKQVGRNYDLGYADGILKNVDIPEDAAKFVANSSLTTLDDEIKKHNFSDVWNPDMLKVKKIDTSGAEASLDHFTDALGTATNWAEEYAQRYAWAMAKIGRTAHNFRLSYQDAQKLAGDIIPGGTGKAKNQAEEMAEHYASLKEMKEKAIDDNEKLDEKAVSNESKATEKSKSTKSKFVLDNSEFWKTLYAQNQSGIYGVHNQLEKFADWEESTVKRVESIVKDFKENGLANAIKETNSGLFSKVSEEKKEVSKEELKKNLQDQIAQIQDYNRTMAQLEYRITDVNLRDAIAEMGMDSLAELKALNSMTDQELTEYTGLYNQKLLANFNGIKDKASMQVSELLGGAPMDITKLATSWDGTAKQLGEMAATAIQTHLAEALTKGVKLDEATLNGMKFDQLAPQIQAQLAQASKELLGEDITSQYTTSGKTLADNLIVDGVQAEMEAQKDATAQVGHDVMDATVNEMGDTIGDDVKPKDPAKQGINIGQNLMLGVQKGIEDEQEPLTVMVKTLMDNLLLLLEEYQDDFEELGANLGEGLAKGILEKIEECKNAMNDLVNDGLIGPYCATTETESPSKLFTRYGGYLVEGLARGILNNVGLAASATSTLTDSMTNPMYEAIQSIGDIASGQMDINPVITPVLDLSSLGSSVMQMNSMLNDRQIAIKNASVEADLKFTNQLKDMVNSRPNQITNNVTVDGAEDPNAWAQSFVNTMRREMRTSYA